MSLFHVQGEEGHTYWHEIATKPRFEWESGHIPVEVPEELVAAYKAARQLVEGLYTLLSPHGNAYYKANRCVVCGEGSLAHAGHGIRVDHAFDPVGIVDPPPR